MKRGFIILLVLLSLSIIILSFYIAIKNSNIHTDENLIEENNSFTGPSDRVLEFMDFHKSWIDFENKCVACILNKTCEGEIWLGISTNLSENITQINQTLTKYGEVQRIYNHSKEYSIRFKINDFYKNMDEILNKSFFNWIQVERIEPYFDFNNESLSYCENDTECIFVTKGCCGCGESTSISINKKYLSDWSSCHEASCWSSGCAAVVSNHWTCFFQESKCINNKCEVSLTNSSICNREFSTHNYSMYDYCKDLERHSKTDIDKLALEDKSTFGGINLSCNDILSICI